MLAMMNNNRTTSDSMFKFKHFLFAFLLFLSSITPSYSFLFSRDDIMNLIPSSCTQSCQTMSTNFDTCVYGTCICTSNTGQALEECMSCLYNLSPTTEVYDSVQQVFSVFEDTCRPANFSLSIIPNTNATSTVISSSNTSTGSSTVGGAPATTVASSQTVTPSVNGQPSDALPSSSGSTVTSLTSVSGSVSDVNASTPTSKTTSPSANTGSPQAPLRDGRREVCYAVAKKGLVSTKDKMSSRAVVRLKRRAAVGSESESHSVWWRITDMIFSVLRLW